MGVDMARLTPEEKAGIRATLLPGSMAQEKIDQIETILVERDKLEAECELLENTGGSAEFYGNRMIFNSRKNQFIQTIAQHTLEDAIRNWINEIAGRSPETAKTYGCGMRRLEQIGVISFKRSDGEPFTVEDFRDVPHERIVDFIKLYSDWTEDSRQTRAAGYISFTKWLSRITEGWIREAKPQSSGTGKTFYKTRDKVSTEALSIHDCHRLLDAITDINERDGLISKAAFGGARRISEVLEVELPSIDFEKNAITYRISKNKGTLRKVTVTYSEDFMDELKSYIESSSESRGTSSILFITRQGKSVVRQRLNDSFTQASKNLGWLKINVETQKWEGRKVSPHTLRTSWITYARSQGFGADDIGEVTGQSTTTVRSYDKSKIEDNISKKIQVV